MKIGFFDSGIGGLTVFKEALRLFPNEDYIYFADSQNAPYGRRTRKEVEQLMIDAIDFLAEKNIDVLVIACHTASKLMGEKLRSRYDFPIIGMHPGISKTYASNNFKKTLVCGTDLSIKFWKMQLSQSPINAHYQSLQKLVVFAENFELDSSDVFDYLYTSLAHYDWCNYDSIVLGCTHFPFFKYQIQKLLPEHVQILDGSLATALQLHHYISDPNLKKNNVVQYFVSKVPEKTSSISKYLSHDLVFEINFETA